MGALRPACTLLTLSYRHTGASLVHVRTTDSEGAILLRDKQRVAVSAFSLAYLGHGLVGVTLSFLIGLIPGPTLCGSQQQRAALDVSRVSLEGEETSRCVLRSAFREAWEQTRRLPRMLRCALRSMLESTPSSCLLIVASWRNFSQCHKCFVQSSTCWFLLRGLDV